MKKAGGFTRQKNLFYPDLFFNRMRGNAKPLNISHPYSNLSRRINNIKYALINETTAKPVKIMPARGSNSL